MSTSPGVGKGAIRAGELDWKDVEDADINTRLKWVGLLHRAKRNPGTFMMRLRVINGIVTSEQMRFYADSVEPYGPEVGVVDITTRQNIQLRGVALEYEEVGVGETISLRLERDAVDERQLGS